MFGGFDISKIGTMMKQLGSFRENMETMQGEFEKLRAKGTALGGMIEIEADGLGQLRSCKIDPAVFKQADAELLEELIVNAANDALSQIKAQQADSLQGLTGGIDVPGLNEMMQKFM